MIFVVDKSVICPDSKSPNCLPVKVEKGGDVRAMLWRMLKSLKSVVILQQALHSYLSKLEACTTFAA